MAIIFSRTIQLFKMDGYRALKAGQQVQFNVHQGAKGNHASLIVLCGIRDGNLRLTFSHSEQSLCKMPVTSAGIF
ncbi:cold-shock protein [Erwinia tracheiphila PSU-1]|nr:cold-shock protein [Erwinia tracheiphila PSU-1]